jgi:S-adenosylmethionine hydrolase
MENSPRIITLLTDFGLRDHFVAAMKGVMLGLNPELTLVDISHLIPPQDIISGAFTLGQAYGSFPPGTIHLAVVDPGVGTERKALAVSAGGFYFVAPDNGILTYPLQAHAGFRAHQITAEHYFRKPTSATFHGRDIFAPAAAWLSRDIQLRQFGPPLEKPLRLDIPSPVRERNERIHAAILAVDQFGNLITNLTPQDLPVYQTPPASGWKIVAGEQEITSFHQTFAEGAREELFVLPGSTGYLEIAECNGSAAEHLNLSSGAKIEVIFS